MCPSGNVWNIFDGIIFFVIIFSGIIRHLISSLIIINFWFIFKCLRLLKELIYIYFYITYKLSLYHLLHKYKFFIRIINNYKYNNLFYIDILLNSHNILRCLFRKLETTFYHKSIK